MSQRKTHGRLHDARARSSSAAIDGEGSNRHEMVRAESMNKAQGESRGRKREQRHDRTILHGPEHRASDIGHWSLVIGRQTPRQTAKMPRVAQLLVVEDHQDIADLIRHYMEGAGHSVEWLAAGDRVVSHARTLQPDLIILDLMLPGLDGMMVCQALRHDARTAAIPVVMLTAKGEESDRIRGLELGADDYVVKPFSPKELVARVSALLRRLERPKTPPRVLRYGPITIDLERHHVQIGDREVRLTAKEFLLLQYLIEHQGRVLSRDLLLTDVWGYQYTGGTRTVDVHVRRLREKVPLLATAIATIKQFGYKLDDPPRP